ncbi:class I SAM-dependent methyltransferase [Nocardia tengchongensis]|uniref:Class I SAM-dependent methyltransferase n=1 Tax=Nocardia tengchongensis TaxID=2055889 RepID=A0ABX8CJA8_9NOCA|nr:class I SAM-dependent methyltransferase [Nocardia tengchongensis]QVI20058.1 class I SAM-dependent methyltransferase [Nocardia tengchongensis]
MPDLIDDAHLEQTAVVANSAMNRDRRLPAYRRELGFDPVAWLAARPGPQRWLDVGCGSALALFEAAEHLPGNTRITGLDLVGYFRGTPKPGVELVTGSVLSWSPDSPIDLITSVHAIHYVGDKLAALTRMSSWLAPDGRLALNFDATSLRDANGGPLGRRFSTALRRNGFTYTSRTHRLTRTGHAIPAWSFSYLGADPLAGPNYTGQEAVSSHYASEGWEFESPRAHFERPPSANSRD